MKFSDMMGKGTKTEDPAETAVPPARVKAPPVPEAPIRFAAAPPPLAPPAEPVAVEASTAAPVEAVTPLDARPAPPAILDVMTELAPRRGAASSHELDASSWLDGIGAIDDDLLPS